MSCVSWLQFKFQVNIPNLKVTNHTVPILTLLRSKLYGCELEAYLPKTQVPTFPHINEVRIGKTGKREMPMLLEAFEHEALIQRNELEMGWIIVSDPIYIKAFYSFINTHSF